MPANNGHYPQGRLALPYRGQLKFPCSRPLPAPTAAAFQACVTRQLQQPTLRAVVSLSKPGWGAAAPASSSFRGRTLGSSLRLPGWRSLSPDPRPRADAAWAAKTGSESLLPSAERLEPATLGLGDARGSAARCCRLLRALSLSSGWAVLEALTVASEAVSAGVSGTVQTLPEASRKRISAAGSLPAEGQAGHWPATVRPDG